MKGAATWFNATEPSKSETSPPASGIFYFDLDFGKLTFLQRNDTYVKVGLVFVASFLLALLTSLLRKLSGLDRTENQMNSLSNKSGRNGSPTSTNIKTAILSRLRWDFYYGVMVVLLLGYSLRIYSLGAINPLDKGFSFGFLTVGFAGAVIAELMKWRFTGRHLTAGEVFINVFVSGFLAASSTREQLWQAPATWIQLFTVSNLTASVTFLIYHIFNAQSLASSKKHLRGITTSLIVGTPYLFGWLLLVENINLMYPVINAITFGFLAAWPEILKVISRILVMFVFNEAVTNGISRVLKGKYLPTLKAHLFILYVSIGVIVSPFIADLGSTAAVASLPVVLRAIVAVLTTMLSYAGLWGEVYLITGILLDGGHRLAPTPEMITKHVKGGITKAMSYSGILMAMMYVLGMLLGTPVLQKIMSTYPFMVGILAGALVFPLLKTIIETFDGSIAFLIRARDSYRNWPLYLRGAVAGFGFASMIMQGMFQKAMPERILFGLVIGFVAGGGVSFIRDVVYALRKQGRIQTWKLYWTDSILGAFIGAAAAFYLDSRQVPVIIEKFKLYLSSGLSGVEYITYPLVNKWGRVDLGVYTGGVKLLYTESLAGVINWSIAAWLFAINKVFMQAYFEKQTAPIKFFFSKEGFAQLVEHMIYVLRWGLWMSPIIFTFLRMMPNPTWYNQDGAIRTFFAIFNNLTMSPDAFNAWSLKIFIFVMAFDWFRILIWMDHMGLRVATLVNWSFLGLDRVDERVARWIGPAAAQRYIPDAVKRFATWAPLLIPFYLPRGGEWDIVWSTSEAMQNGMRGKGLVSQLQSLSLSQMLTLIGIAVLVCTAASFVMRLLRDRARKHCIASHELRNRYYKVVLKENGEIYSAAEHKRVEIFPPDYDITRRSYNLIDPCGRVLFLVDTAQPDKSPKRYWPVVGNYPSEKFNASEIVKSDDSLVVTNTSHGIRTTIEIRLFDQDTTAELWNVAVENLTDEPRPLKVVPYLEWLLNGGVHDRFHTQYQRLFPEMEYISEVNAILAWNRSTKAMGFLATDLAPEGFHNSRMDFIGRAQSIWKPRILETLDFLPARNTERYPTFDPIGTMLINVPVKPKASMAIRLMIGYSKNKEGALELIRQHLNPQPARVISPVKEKKRPFLIGHGEILPGTPQPYSEFIANGNKLRVHTPYTPRPYDHAMSNAAGHCMMVTNRGLLTSSNGNSQQNRLTPDWPDTVTVEVPSEAIYLYDPDRKEWYSPTYHPLNDPAAETEAEFGVDGTAVFRMHQGTLSTEMTVFVPPDDPLGVYLLTVRNNEDQPRRIRIAPYFEMVLEFQPERSGTLQIVQDKALGALYFENCRNMFRSGWAFASTSMPSDCIETQRGRFFGKGRSVQHPWMVEKGESDMTHLSDSKQIAGFLGTIQIPARGEYTVAVVLGQTRERREARRLVQKYKNLQTVRESLENTRKWWLSLMETVTVTSNHPEFDRFHNWLKYQALAERVWARRGFYQTSGAYGFRDQLQDTVNLIWVDPCLARQQIKLCASQQFLQGDVYHWFFTRTDGRSAFSCRSHASDNPLWLVWAVVEYIKATADDSILDELTPYCSAQFPFEDLPKNKAGWGHLYHTSTRADSVYKHCMRSIDLVLEKRMGQHGLPLIRTGDWNDGLDEIGSEGKGESVWLGFFFYYIMKDMVDVIERKEGRKRREYYARKMQALKDALEQTWREDRYLRAYHDDG
ncbi:MAG: hypothetical protein NC930_06725, partial [Candidatus Omnitrophica bacterium]|nr:hypothetical protein [Candidatus Omnitrophota bacterium]